VASTSYGVFPVTRSMRLAEPRRGLVRGAGVSDHGELRDDGVVLPTNRALGC
jgi:hypothetical protein